MTTEDVINVQEDLHRILVEDAISVSDAIRILDGTIPTNTDNALIAEYIIPNLKRVDKSITALEHVLTMHRPMTEEEHGFYPSISKEMRKKGYTGAYCKACGSSLYPCEEVLEIQEILK